MVLVISNFHMQKNLSMPFKRFASPLLGQKSFKHAGWRGAYPHVSGQPCSDISNGWKLILFTKFGKNLHLLYLFEMSLAMWNNYLTHMHPMNSLYTFMLCTIASANILACTTQRLLIVACCYLWVILRQYMVQEVVWVAGASEGQCFFFNSVWKMSMDSLERWTGV